MKKIFKRAVTSVLALVLFSAFTIQYASAQENTVSVRDFLVAPSQYTNMENFGVHIEKTINGSSSIVSLGNFGGYVIYEFENPVYDSDTHKFGVDFIVTGNAFAAVASAQEPGQVWVSKDGDKWYALAGSEHFEDGTLWNYSLTYSKNPENELRCNYSDSLGDINMPVSEKTASRYPNASIYTLADIPEDNLTLSGILLKKARLSSTDNVIVTKFGYVDTLKSAGNGESFNPYLENYANDCRDGQFDIAWAVKSDGSPANLDYIKYVKVQTAAFIDSGAFGEKSTEVTSIRNVNEVEKVGVTAAPASITVNGEALDLTGGESVFNVPVSDSGYTVSADTNANVYINNAFGCERVFDKAPDKGIIRVIVQSDDSEPLIYYINIPTEGGTQPPADDEPVEEFHCSHICHKNGLLKLIWKILNTFFRLLNINSVCECGLKHY